PFARANLEYAVVQGLGFASILLLGYGVLLGQGMDTARSHTAVFVALVTGLFLLILGNRAVSRSLLTRQHANNPWLLRMFGGVVVTLGLIIGVPFLRDLMRFALPDGPALIGSACMLLLALFWLELWRRAAGQIKQWNLLAR
ncbi:MAG: cation transporting ATPase C-terminal domain-containing protein, partial [Rhodanobacter sp.]